MPVTRDTQNDNTQLEEVPHIHLTTWRMDIKLAVIRVLQCYKDFKRGAWTLVQGRLPGRAPAEPSPCRHKEVSWWGGEGKEGVWAEQWPWLQTFPFRQHETLLPPSSDPLGLLFPINLEAELTTLYKPTNKWSIQDSAPPSCPHGNSVWDEHATIEIAGDCCCFMVIKVICNCREKLGQKFKSSGPQRGHWKMYFFREVFLGMDVINFQKTRSYFTERNILHFYT